MERTGTRLVTYAIALACACGVALADNARVHGDRLQTFESTWEQHVNTGEEWVQRGSVREVLEVVEEDGRKLWLRTQVATQGPVGFINRSYFDRKTLRPVRFVREIAPDVPEEFLPRLEQAGYVPKFQVTFDGAAYRTVVTGDGGREKTTDQGSFDEVPYDGSVLGLVIAALPLAADYTTRFPIAFIAPQDGSITRYIVEARVAGREAVGVGDGKTTDAWRVDVDWLDPDTMEVTSKGGPDEAGGAYYVLTKPGRGLPHVPKYRNESVDFELTAER